MLQGGEKFEGSPQDEIREEKQVENPLTDEELTELESLKDSVHEDILALREGLATGELGKTDENEARLGIERKVRRILELTERRDAELRKLSGPSMKEWWGDPKKFGEDLAAWKSWKEGLSNEEIKEVEERMAKLGGERGTVFRRFFYPKETKEE